MLEHFYLFACVLEEEGKRLMHSVYKTYDAHLQKCMAVSFLFWLKIWKSPNSYRRVLNCMNLLIGDSNPKIVASLNIIEMS